MRRLLAVFACCYVVQPVSAVQASPFQPASYELATRVIAPSIEPTRFLRGDWETPDVLVLALTGYFSDFAAFVMQQATTVPDTELTMLLSEADRTAGFGPPVDSYLNQQARMHLVSYETDSPWVRDYGPLQTYEQGGGIIWLDAEYADDRPADDRVPQTLSRFWGVPLERLPWRIDGGALISNGFGLCASTLEAFQNGGVDVEDQQAMDALLQQIGCSVMVLVPALSNDNTKHIDMFAQFVAPDRVVVAAVDSSISLDDAGRMDLAMRGLLDAADVMGIELQVFTVPLLLGENGYEYYTYLNGLRLGDAFLVPSYRAVSIVWEKDAYDALARAMPDVELVQVPADDMIELEGAVHCLALGLNRR